MWNVQVKYPFFRMEDSKSLAPLPQVNEVDGEGEECQ